MATPDRAAAFRAALRLYISRVCYPYQRRWLAMFGSGKDCAILGSRQRGKDWIVALWIALRLIWTAEEWHVVSATEKHSKKMLKDVKRHLRALRKLADRCGYPMPEVKIGVLEGSSATGATVYAHAARGESVVGMRENIVLNELSALTSQEAQALYDAAEPIATNARHNGRRGQMIILTNATRAGHWLQGMWEGDAWEDFERDLLTWNDGLRELGWSEEKIAEEERAIRKRTTSIGWRRWYRCEFTQGGDGYLSDVLDPARYAHLPDGWEKWPQIVAYDIGRTSDPSVILRMLLAPSGARWCLPAIYLRGMAYKLQRARLKSVCRERKTIKVVIDASLNEDHWRECAGELSGLANVHPWRGSQALHWSAFEDLRADLEAGRLHLDTSDTALINDLEDVEATVSDRGKPQILLPKTKLTVDGDEVTRHCDGAVAAAMGNAIARAGIQAPPPPLPPTPGVTTPIKQW